MHRTRLYLCATSTVVAAALAWALWPDADPVRERLQTVQDGLTRAEVDRLMGEPDELTVIGQEVAILTYNGSYATGTILIDLKSDRVYYTQWRPQDPIWLRLWHRVTTSPGM